MKTLRKNHEHSDKRVSTQVSEVKVSDKISYESPTLKVIEVEVEMGFAASLNDYGDETA